MLPRKLPKEKRPARPRIDIGRRAGPIRCAPHLKWVRTHRCCVPGCENRDIVAAHVRTGTDGALSVKPGDQWTLSLCFTCHAQQHAIGESSFEAKHGIDMKDLAREFARLSPHRRKLVTA
jgi:hypothetical protein